MDSLTLELPWPPSANTYWRKGKHGIYLGPAGRRFKDEVTTDLHHVHGFDGALVTVELSLNPPTKRQYDVDNRIKPVLDALQSAGIFNDDSQVQCVSACKAPIIKYGRCVAIIRRCDGQLQQSCSCWEPYERP